MKLIEGDIVMYRNGQRRLVMGCPFGPIGMKMFLGIHQGESRGYDSDGNAMDGEKDYDIMKVYDLMGIATLESILEGEISKLCLKERWTR